MEEDRERERESLERAAYGIRNGVGTCPAQRRAPAAWLLMAV